MPLRNLPIVCINPDAATSVPSPSTVRILGENTVGARLVLAAIGYGDLDDLCVGADKEDSLRTEKKSSRSSLLND